ncbi:MAG: hypothetical protein KY454_02600 [Actinobacteria bacterium]|nr:hypothetical protein [Actinomycetota bacterium]
MSRRRLGLLAALILLVASSFALVSPAHANTNCDNPQLKVSEGASDVAGGTLIEFIVNCRGNETITEEVKAEIDNVLVFKATVDKRVSGSLYDREAIHLPPLPKVPKVCVTVHGVKVCVPA